MLSKEEIKSKIINGRFIHLFPIHLNELACICISYDGTLEGLNEYVDEYIVDGLSDLNYRPVGVQGDMVLIEVNADASDILEEDEEEGDWL